MANASVVPIGVFWDIENCNVPRWKSALPIVKSIRENFFAGRREVEFLCVCDTTKESRDVLQDLTAAQVCYCYPLVNNIEPGIVYREWVVGYCPYMLAKCLKCSNV